METERIGYEQTFGKISSPYQFLKLLTEDPWFAWFRPVSQLIATIDETLDAKEPLTVAAAEALMSRAKTMLVPTEGGEGFSQHYDEALQRDPDVVFAHAAVAKLLRPPAGGHALTERIFGQLHKWAVDAALFPHILSGLWSPANRRRPRLFSCSSFAI